MTNQLSDIQDRVNALAECIFEQLDQDSVYELALQYLRDSYADYTPEQLAEAEEEWGI